MHQTKKGNQWHFGMRLLKNDNQLAMLFTLANLFRADQMIRQWERSHPKLGIAP